MSVVLVEDNFCCREQGLRVEVDAVLASVEGVPNKHFKIHGRREKFVRLNSNHMRSLITLDHELLLKNSLVVNITFASLCSFISKHIAAQSCSLVLSSPETRTTASALAVLCIGKNLFCNSSNKRLRRALSVSVAFSSVHGVSVFE